MKLASAKEGDKVRALGGIDRDPDWQAITHPGWRPIPNERHTVAGVGSCRCGCGTPLIALRELDAMMYVGGSHPHVNVRPGTTGLAGLKPEWFTTEGARTQ